MAKVEIYNSIEQKSNYFEHINVDSKEHLNELLAAYKKEQSKYGLVFRGMTEAKYKLYNSAQRHWLNLELQKLGHSFIDFISLEINNAKNWQNRLLEKFFNAFGQPAFDISVLSFLQHYGAPTPLLDWTYNFENALFFATDGLKYSNSDNSIDNYCSIYIIDTKWRDLINYLEYIQSSLSQIDDILENSPKVNADQVLNDLENFNYNNLAQIQLAQIPGYKRNGFAFSLKNRPSFNLVWNQQNLNIINQKGLFIFNGSEDKPLEYFFQGQNQRVKDSPYYLPKITCLNIHKSLYEYITLKLTKGKRFPINAEYIYPQEESIANNSFKHYLNQDFF
ncbi:FRG domain-containing protein [Mariniflexile maritimum]|uniref:FRG domain-containing protein n=1 Tax=Mariniflexile maritimum TaxID=2682493 RepID=UPI0012F68513|nr:FRG domain-containing protein [Mariniflexile maritimum]